MPMKNFLPPLLLALVLVCGFSACSNPEFIASGIKLELTKIERASDGSVQVAWRVGNPNVFPYLLSKTSHKIKLNGVLVGVVTDNSPLGIPAQDHAECTGVLTPANPAAGATIEQAIAQGSAAYRLDSSVFVLLLDDKSEKVLMTSSGTVAVTTK